MNSIFFLGPVKFIEVKFAFSLLRSSGFSTPSIFSHCLCLHISSFPTVKGTYCSSIKGRFKSSIWSNIKQNMIWQEERVFATFGSSKSSSFRHDSDVLSGCSFLGNQLIKLHLMSWPSWVYSICHRWLWETHKDALLFMCTVSYDLRLLQFWHKQAV